VRSALAVPVKIERIESEPLSHLTVTKLHSVSTKAENRFHFGARSISAHYDPIELLGGRIRSAVFASPEIFINLDADLAGIARVPELGQPSRSWDKQPRGSSGALLSFLVDETRIEDGSLTLQLNGRKLDLARLRVELRGLGQTKGQGFHLSVEALGGVVRAWGELDVERRADAATRFTFRGARLVIDDVDASRLLGWLAPAALEEAWFGPLLARAKGTLSFEGWLEGTWPETVSVSLATHAIDVSTSYSDEVAFQNGSLGLHVDAEVSGDLETVKFTVSTHGEGDLDPIGPDPERGRIELSGELRRNEGADGTLHLSPSTIVLENAGELRLSGSVASILGGSPVLDLALEALAIDAGVLLRRIPRALRGNVLDEIARHEPQALLGAKVRMSGPIARPSLEGMLELSGVSFPRITDRPIEGSLRIDVERLERDDRTSSWSVRRLKVQTPPVPARSIAIALGLPPAELNAAGTVSVNVEASDQSFPPSSSGLKARCEVVVQSGGGALAQESAGISGLNGTLAADAAFYPPSRKLVLSVTGNAAAHEVLFGRFYASLDGKAMSLDAQTILEWDRSWTLNAASVSSLTVHLPFTGPLRATGSLFRELEGSDLIVDASVEARDIPGNDAFQVFVVEPFASAAGFLAGGKLEGNASAMARIEGRAVNPSVWGQLVMPRADLILKDAAVLGISLEIPFEAGARAATEAAPAGFIEAGDVQLGGARLGEVKLAFRLVNGTYEIEPAELSVYGGKVSLGPARLSLRGPNGPVAELPIKVNALQVSKIAKAHGLTRFPGAIDADLKPVRLEGSRLDARGKVSLRAFGGEITFKDLVLDNVAEPYADLRLGEGVVSRLRLDQLGKAFRFGLMSGVLNGQVTGLELTGGEVSAFRIDAATVPVRGVAQYLDRAAIESLRRVLTGPLGAIEETFFSRFKFADFGFTCSLEDGVFRLRGKHSEGGKEFIMRARWYQLPQVNIINGRPDQNYDWRTIVENLRRITERKQEP